MASREIVVLVCDLCDKDSRSHDVETHTLTVDGMTVEAEACSSCWAGAVKALAPLAKAGRRPPKKVTKRAKRVSRDVVDWPGSRWQFSSHALVRIGERFLNPLDVLHVADHPTTSYPGLKPELEVRVGKGGVKVVVNPSTWTVVTAANRDEEVDAVA